MHFVGLAGHILKDESDVVLHVTFDVIESFLSLITCIVFVYVGLYISSRDKMFCRDKEEILKLIVADSKQDSLGAVRSKNYIMKVALFRGVGPLLLGGVITGGGFCIMHYVGMLAMHADVTVHWHIGAVIASVIIAVLAATASFWILFRFLALFPEWESLRILSSVFSAMAMCGMHYVGMLAATYTVNHDPPAAKFGFTINQHKADLIVTTVAVLNTLLVSMIVQAELRRWHLYLHARLKASRKVLDQLRERYDTDLLLQNFESKNARLSSTHEVSHVEHSTASHGAAYTSMTSDAKVHMEDVDEGAEDGVKKDEEKMSVMSLSREGSLMGVTHSTMSTGSAAKGGSGWGGGYAEVEGGGGEERSHKQ
jgi:NO-binding membrane sensor protein with MHYT domain